MRLGKNLLVAIVLASTSITVYADDKLFESLDAANQAFAKAILSGDINHLVGDYADDACVFAPSTPKACGKEAIRAFWTALIASSPIDVKITTHAVGSSGDLAHATGTLEVTGSNNAIQLSRFVLVQKRVQGVWKLYLDMWTPA